MTTTTRISRHNFYAAWFNLYSPPEWARRKGYGVCGIYYVPGAQGEAIRPIMSRARR